MCVCVCVVVVLKREPNQSLVFLSKDHILFVECVCVFMYVYIPST